MRECFSCLGDKLEQTEFDNGLGIVHPCQTCEGKGVVDDGCFCNAYCSCECICGSWYDVECHCWEDSL